METPRSDRRFFGRVKDVKDGRACVADVHNGSPASPGATTLVGEVVFGWGTNRSPSCASPRSPRSVDVNTLFQGAAGHRTGRQEERNKSKRRCHLGMSTTMDEVINGRDIDGSGDNPHVKFMEQFDEHAGLRSGEKVMRDGKEKLKKPGCALSRQSVVDSVIFGRDVDFSGEDPHETTMSQFNDHAGQRSREARMRLAKPGLRLKSTVDSVLYGRDIDGSGDQDAHEVIMAERNAGAAGVRSGERNRGRKNLLQMQSGVDIVVFNKEQGDVAAHDFENVFSDYAGVKTGQSILRRMASAPPGFLSARSAQEPPSTTPLEGCIVEEGRLPSEAGNESLLSEQRLAKHQLTLESQGERTPPQSPAVPTDAQLAAAASGSGPPTPASPSGGYAFTQRVNPFGVRRASSASSCSSTSQLRTARGTDKRICFDECASASSRGSQRPKWR